MRERSSREIWKWDVRAWRRKIEYPRCWQLLFRVHFWCFSVRKEKKNMENLTMPAEIVSKSDETTRNPRNSRCRLDIEAFSSFLSAEKFFRVIDQLVSQHIFGCSVSSRSFLAESWSSPCCRWPGWMNRRNSSWKYFSKSIFGIFSNSPRRRRRRMFDELSRTGPSRWDYTRKTMSTTRN